MVVLMANLEAPTAISAMIDITLAYAPTPDQQYYQQMRVCDGSTILEVLQLSGWLERFAELASWCAQVGDQDTPSAKAWHIGVFSQKQPLNYVLKAQDRVEVYRSLKLDPMGNRKKRAIKKNQR